MLESEAADMASQKAFEKAARSTRKRAKSEANTPPAAPPAGKADPDQQAGFFQDDDGLWYVEKRGDAFRPAAWVCAPIKVKFRIRDLAGYGWRIILTIQDRDGNQRDVVLLDADIGGQDGGWHRALSDAGLRIHPRRRGELGQFLLLDCDGAPRAVVAEKTGLHGNAYVLHNQTVGETPEPILYMGSDRTAVFSQAGTLDEWRETVGRYAVGNSRMILAICASLAAPLLPLSGIGESGGLHLYGASGDGKTTLARVAASGWALPLDYLMTWRNTSNATEGTAARFNHFLLVLDEIREAFERDLQATIFMLGNGSGKARMRDNATMRERLTWQLLWLSTGEHATHHYLEAAGLKPDPGMAVRQVDIASDAGRGMGVFEELHGFAGARELAEHLRTACDKSHGTVGIAWLECITRDIATIRADLPAEVGRLVSSLAGAYPGAESQVMRTLRRFALMALAGEMASKHGLTGWPAGTAIDGVRRCIQSWLAQRGGAENLEERRILERFRDFIGRNWQGRFIPWDRATDERAPAKSETVGYRRDAESVESDTGTVTQSEYYITSEGWAEIFRGMDPGRAADVLLSEGLLHPGEWVRDGRKEARPYRREYLPGMGRRLVYRTVSGLFDLLDNQGGDHA